jgi:hypothetical protein
MALWMFCSSFRCRCDVGGVERRGGGAARRKLVDAGGLIRQDRFFSPTLNATAITDLLPACR